MTFKNCRLPSVLCFPSYEAHEATFRQCEEVADSLSLMTLRRLRLSSSVSKSRRQSAVARENAVGGDVPLQRTGFRHSYRHGFGMLLLPDLLTCDPRPRQLFTCFSFRRRHFTVRHELTTHRQLIFHSINKLRK